MFSVRFLKYPSSIVIRRGIPVKQRGIKPVDVDDCCYRIISPVWSGVTHIMIWKQILHRFGPKPIEASGKECWIFKLEKCRLILHIFNCWKVMIWYSESSFGPTYALFMARTNELGEISLLKETSNTRVFAVPRSIARSLENTPITASKTKVITPHFPKGSKDVISRNLEKFCKLKSRNLQRY